MSEAKVFTVFLVRLLQLPVIKTTSHNVILYVSVLGSRSHFMHVSDMICTVQASGKVNGSRDVSAAQKGPIRVRTSMDPRIVSRTSAAAARPTAGQTRASADPRTGRGFANARVRDRVHFSTTPRMCKSIEVVKNGTNEFGYEKSSCLAIAQRTHNLEDPETPRKRRNFRQQEVAVLTTQKVQDHRVSGQPPNREASKEAH